MYFRANPKTYEQIHPVDIRVFLILDFHPSWRNYGRLRGLPGPLRYTSREPTNNRGLLDQSRRRTSRGLCMQRGSVRSSVRHSRGNQTSIGWIES